MTPLIEFLLTQIGLPVITLIIKEYQTAHNGAWPTSEQIVQEFVDNGAKWIKQGEDWLAANPRV